MKTAVDQRTNTMLCNLIELALARRRSLIDDSDRRRRDLVSLMVEGPVWVRTNDFIQKLLHKAVAKEYQDLDKDMEVVQKEIESLKAQLKWQLGEVDEVPRKRQRTPPIENSTIIEEAVMSCFNDDEIHNMLCGLGEFQTFT